jgi:hypothetical protein
VGIWRLSGDWAIDDWIERLSDCDWAIGGIGEVVDQIDHHQIARSNRQIANHSISNELAGVTQW